MNSRLAALFSGCVLIAVVMGAAVPRRINYQGKLLDNNKNPRNGTYSMTFSIWDSGPDVGGGNQLWSGTQNVQVRNGVFSVQLGAASPVTSSVFSGTTAYLQIEIDGEVAGQRQRLITSPYSFRAASADDLLPGDNDYIQNVVDLQEDAVFFVSSGTVAGPLNVGGNFKTEGTITAGPSNHQITTAAGLMDAPN